MSLINEVLTQLEQRGAQTSPNQTQVRAVSISEERHWGKHVWGVVAILLLVVAVYAIRSFQNESQIEHTLPEIPAEPINKLAVSESSDPASKLSYELSALPLPDSLRDQGAENSVKVKPEAKPIRPASPRAALVSNKQADEKSPVVQQVPSVAPAIKQVSQTQQADAEFRKAVAMQQQGRVNEALAGYEVALRLNPQHDSARLAFAALLLESKRGADAERVLQEGLKLRANQVGLSMALARVQVEQGAIDQALSTMQKNLPKADGKADYQAFYAALLQRRGRHKEAINHYQIATELVPSNGVWWMGYGISLQEVQRNDDARASFKKALATHTLTPELNAFVEQKLKSL
ncbi:MAG: tetratricopeptide repeat protein [Sideroxydans sp.]|jgi:MSHA biogenesis protein MshN